ncbi:hypothetical protein B0H14DRAFT_2633683, partial [Mycena olivaceomarginata]
PQAQAQVEELQASKKSLEERAARGSTQDDQPDDDIVQLNKPPGEAGDKNEGLACRQPWISTATMSSTERSRLRIPRGMLPQLAPDKLSAVFKLMRKDHTYLTKKRFPLDWASAEMVKSTYATAQACRQARSVCQTARSAASNALKAHPSPPVTSVQSRADPVRHIDDTDDEQDDQAPASLRERQTVACPIQEPTRKSSLASSIRIWINICCFTAFWLSENNPVNGSLGDTMRITLNG